VRFYILKALVLKEIHRHLANRGGLALAFLLVVAALLLSIFDPGTGSAGSKGGGLVDGVHRCIIDYAQDSPLIDELRASVPPALQQHVNFRRRRPDDVNGLLKDPPGTGAIRIESRTENGREVLKCSVWYPPGDPGAMAPYELWFWKALRTALQKQAVEKLQKAGVAAPLSEPDPGTDDLWAIRDSFHQLDLQVERLGAGRATIPKVEIARDDLAADELDLRSAVATGMVVFALYFACVYLLPTLNCEERERGVLLAQALSPASPAEILTAKFLFYPVLGMTLAATLAGIYKPAVLSTLFFWLSLLAISAGFLGIGMTIATLAKTQRAAFMGSMCYLLSVSLVLFICSMNGIPGVPWLALEYHGPRILHAAMTGKVDTMHWGHLAGAATLACVWILLAGWLFRKRGWQ